MIVTYCVSRNVNCYITDELSSIFINDASTAITEAELQNIWQELTADLLTPQGENPQIFQAQQTWCVEMLMRGMSLENLSILTGSGMTELEPYAQRAREKDAIAAATQLDRKPPPSYLLPTLSGENFTTYHGP